MLDAALLLVVLVGVVGGVAVGVQAPLASLMGQRLGALESVFIVHLGGALFALLPLLALRGGNLAQWQSIPWYALAAGAFGLVVISSISYTMPRLGVAVSVVLLIAGQLLIGVLMDHFGLLGMAVRPLTLMRLLGFAVLCVGVWLMVR